VEVARRSGVSPSTASRVLNNAMAGRFSVSPDVRDRIVRAARELNYRPSMAARNLAVAKTRLVAVLGLGGIGSDRVGPVEAAVGAMTKALDAAGYEICVQFMSRRRGPFDLPPLRVDGVVAVGARRHDDLQALEESGIPYVSVNGVTGPRGSLVVPDDAGGTRLALRHLVDLGHRSIAYLDNPSADADHVSVTERRNAFGDAAGQLGFRVPPLGIPPLTGDAPWDSYYEPFVRRAVLDGRATAVLTYSHHGALALMRTAHDLGLSVPSDLSVVCFNDEPVARLWVPSITAVDIPSVRMGQVAAELLLRQMSSDASRRPERVLLDESLVVRESSRPPATGMRRPPRLRKNKR
jgi:DNA-binding LacI/PurR family transcriptional regulator